MHMSQEKLEFGKSLVEELERLITELDPKLSKLDLEHTLEYMVYIRGKMFAHFYVYGGQKEIESQIIKMQNCINIVRKMIQEKDASSM